VPFNSRDFIVFFVFVVAIFNLVPRRFQSLCLLLASYFFYAYSYPTHLLILLVVTGMAFWGAQWVEKHQNKGVFGLVVALTLMPLIVFKYGDFTVTLLTDLSSAVEGQSGNFKLLLPLGVSFFTLQAVSYVSDVYNRNYRAESRIRAVALYLAFFPQILSGPIERAQKLIPQLGALGTTRPKDLFVGGKILLWGFFCKLVIADKLALIVDPVFADLTSQSGLTLAFALFLYSFQIYYDFYGYTQIAIGLARCFGVQLSINFNNPYVAASIQDFWHRWHITLSSWFRDYVYIPFGGKFLTGPTFGLVIILVFLLSGLWHGSSLNFLLWGLTHALLYLFGHLTRPVRDTVAEVIFRGSLGSAIRKIGGRILVFSMVSFAWLFFRVESLTEIVVGLKKLLLLDTTVSFVQIGDVYNSYVTFVFVGILALTYCLHVSGVISRSVEMIPRTTPQIARELALVNSFIIPILLVGDIGTRDFIYFRF